MRLCLRRVSPIVAVCCLLGGGPMGTGAYAQSAFSACEQAGIAAEQNGGVPAGLLLAIGRVESGRWDASRGRVTPWPWTMNAAGKGQWFASKEDAAVTVKAQLDGGTRSIDVGCFQVNLLWHSSAFGSLDEAFDPDANARYAARFLLSLFARTGSWEAAVEAYHSADPALGFAYRQQVFATWSEAATVNTAATSVVRAPAMSTLAAMTRPAVALPVVIAGVNIWTPMPAGSGARVVAMPGAPQMDARPVPAQALPVVSYRVMPRR